MTAGSKSVWRESHCTLDLCGTGCARRKAFQYNCTALIMCQLQNAFIRQYQHRTLPLLFESHHFAEE